MIARIAKVGGTLGIVTLCVVYGADSRSQTPIGAPQTNIGEGPASAEVPGVAKGVDVQARGPVHEAFATPSTEPGATPPIAKKPPAPLEEMPPEEKPEGSAEWIGGYWAFDDDRQDFLWVSGCWRVKPEGKDWVPGYWREQGERWQWVPGFWTNVAAQGQKQEVTYYPEPPAQPQVAPPGDPPNADSFYVPGYQMWNGERYIWRAGYWGRVRAGYIYVPSHYRWTPLGYVFVGGYWDYNVPRRGVLYAPVVIDVAVVGPRFVYTPYYAVSDAIVLDALFVRPAHCHYYFGDYYGPRYHSLGFETCVVYSRRHYDPVITYQRWEYRDNPHWFDAQVTLVVARDAGRAPLPPRTLIQQNTIIQNNVTNVTNVTNVKNVTVNKTVLAPTKNVVAARGSKVVALDSTARAQVQQSAQTTNQAVVRERKATELPSSPNNFDSHKPKVASYTAPPPTKPGAGVKTTTGLSKGPANNVAPLGKPLAPSGKGPTNPVYQPTNPLRPPQTDGGKKPMTRPNPGVTTTGKGPGPTNPVVRPPVTPKTPPPATKKDDRKKSPS